MDKVIGKLSEIIDGTKWSEIMKLHWNYKVYLPKEYKENLNKKYPVLYFLHGWGGNLTNLCDKNRVDSKSVLDKLIDNKEINPMIVVLIDGFNSFYLDGPIFKMKSAIVKDLIPFIDSKYRTLSDKKNRAIAGISMGGFGALNIGLSNSDIFSSLGLMSPAIWDKIEEGNPIYGSPLIEIYYQDFYEKLINKNERIDIKLFTYHGKDDSVITYNNIDRFVNFSKKYGFEVKYELQDVGPHGWETWRKSFQKILIMNLINK